MTEGTSILMMMRMILNRILNNPEVEDDQHNRYS